MQRLQTQRTLSLGLLLLASGLIASMSVRSTTALAGGQQTDVIAPIQRPTDSQVSSTGLAQDDILPQCTESSLYGPYAYSRVGTVVDKGPAAANGVVTFDGQGKLAGTDTASVNGRITDRSFKGEYAVAPDCTGTAAFFFSDREIVNIDLQIIAGAREVQFIQTDTGTVITGSAKTQSQRPVLLDVAEAEAVSALGKKISPACEQESLGGGGVQITCTGGGKTCTCIYPKGQAASCSCH
jgi:hypothetical protein